MELKPEDLHAATRNSILGVDFYLTPKNRFAQTLKRATDLAPQRGQHSLFDIAPQTFVFPHEYGAWYKTAVTESEKIWIVKPANGARGEGIYLVEGINTVQQDQNVVLQEYISNPHLLNGYKYTLRVYVAVTTFNPLRAWVYPDGLTKLATQPFTTDHESLDNLFIHLTNPDILINDTQVDFTTQRMTHADYRQLLKRSGHDDEHLFNQIRTIIAKSLLAAREPVLHLQSQTLDSQQAINPFMLLGYDILVDADMKPWIIEVNAGPSLDNVVGDAPVATRENEIKEQVAKEILILGGRLPQAKMKFEPLFPSPAMHSWLNCYEIVHENDRIDFEESE
jgi:hypothetical protein